MQPFKKRLDAVRDLSNAPCFIIIRNVPDKLLGIVQLTLELPS